MHARSAAGKLTGAVRHLFTPASKAPAFKTAGVDFFGQFAKQQQEAEYTLWPDSAQSYNLFTSMLTQLNVGPSGQIIGLRYEALYPLLDRTAKDAAEWNDIFADIRAMEMAAIEEMAQNRD